jgi:SAM-dependent methyltransferase
MTEDMRAHYQRLLAEHGDGHAAVQYSSKASQEARYAVLCRIAELGGSHVLDWGCGTGHLASWLADQGIDCRYTGVDIVPDFLELARAKHPQHRFGTMEDFDGERFDWAIVSGVFNNKMDDNPAFFRHHVRELWARCDRGLAFNLMSTWVDYQAPELWYARPEEIFAFMKSLTPFVTLRNDYVVKDTPVPFEFVVYAYRAPAWSPP